MPQGLGTPIAPIEAQADTEAEEDTEADTPVQASALAEDRVDTEAAMQGTHSGNAGTWHGSRKRY